MTISILLWLFSGYVSACMWKSSSMNWFKVYDMKDVRVSIFMTVCGMLSLFGYAFAACAEPLLSFKISTWNPYKTE